MQSSTAPLAAEEFTRQAVDSTMEYARKGGEMMAGMLKSEIEDYKERQKFEAFQAELQAKPHVLQINLKSAEAPAINSPTRVSQHLTKDERLAAEKRIAEEWQIAQVDAASESGAPENAWAARRRSNIVAAEEESGTPVHGMRASFELNPGDLEHSR